MLHRRMQYESYCTMRFIEFGMNIFMAEFYSYAYQFIVVSAGKYLIEPFCSTRKKSITFEKFCRQIK